MPRYSITAIAAMLLAIVAAAPASAATTWYGTPGGPNAGPCSQQTPCSPEYALETNGSLADGDTVVLAGGDYTPTSGVVVSKRVSIEGATGPQRTRFRSSASVPIPFAYAPSGNLPVHLSDLEGLTEEKYGAGLFVRNLSSTGAVVLDRLRGEAINDDYSTGIDLRQWPSGSGIVLRDSIGRSEDPQGRGIVVGNQSNGAAALTIINSVAAASGAGSIGLLMLTDGVPTCGDFVVTLKNSYVRSALGPNSDLGAAATPCKLELRSFNSNWRGMTPAAGFSVVSNADQSTDGLFADFNAGDYRQLAGSPTIDAGATDSQLGSTDFYGKARPQGAAPDIGVDELPFTATADTVAPAGTALAFSPSRFAVDPKAASSIARKRTKAAKGSTVNYKLSETATVAFKVERQAKGRKQGKKCSATRKKGKRCTMYKAVNGSFSRASTAGANSFRFTGKLAGKKLKRGKYRLLGTPTDGAGNRGVVFRGSFTIVKG